MDRRTFIELLGAVGVLVGNSASIKGLFSLKQFLDVLPEGPVDLNPWMNLDDLAVYGREKTFRLAATNNSDTFAEILVKRIPPAYPSPQLEMPIMRLLVPARGDVTWTAEPGREIVGPMKIITPSHLQVEVKGTDKLGRKVRANKGGLYFLG